MVYLLVFAYLANTGVVEVLQECVPFHKDFAEKAWGDSVERLEVNLGATCEKRSGMYQVDCFSMERKAVMQASLKNDLNDCKQTPVRFKSNIQNMMKKPTL